MRQETKSNRSGVSAAVIHRLTWRGYCAVQVEASTREAAIALAIEQKPAHIPDGTELHYGIVGASRNAIYRAGGEL